jgi:hypothetical protein
MNGVAAIRRRDVIVQLLLLVPLVSNAKIIYLTCTITEHETVSMHGKTFDVNKEPSNYSMIWDDDQKTVTHDDHLLNNVVASRTSIKWRDGEARWELDRTTLKIQMYAQVERDGYSAMVTENGQCKVVHSLPKPKI